MGANRKKYLLLGAMVVLGMTVTLWMGWRFFSYVEAHGGGVAVRTEKGRFALNNHGEMTIVSHEVYSEVKKRGRVLTLCVLLEIFAMATYLILAYRTKALDYCDGE